MGPQCGNETKSHEAEQFFGQQVKQESNYYSVINSLPSPSSAFIDSVLGPCNVS